jgi:hypothetical protein
MGVATQPTLALEELDVVSPGEDIGSPEARDARTDDGDTHGRMEDEVRVGDSHSLRRPGSTPRYNRLVTPLSFVRPIGSLTLALILTAGTTLSPAALGAQRVAHRGRAPLGADAISEAQLRQDLTFIASDALEGRLTPSRGLDVAAAFLASRLGRIGLQPAGDQGTFLQTIALTRRTLDLEKTTLAVGSRTLVYGDDFLPGEVTGSAEGPVIYIGNGAVIRSRGVDPYKGLDVAGKIVVSNLGLPAGFSRGDLKGPRGDDWEATEDAARTRGALAVLFLPDFVALERWPTTRESRKTRTPLAVDAFRDAGPVLPTATLTARGVGLLFAGERITPQEVFQRGVRREPAEPFALTPGKTVRLSVVATDEHLAANNVVAVLEGSDPTLKHEYVALGAHYDHLGTAQTPNDAGDTIYNGADDDGSGTVGLLAIAEAFAAAKTRPKRSVLFVWHAGEEQGLWGSRYFTEHPTVPLDRVVTQLNIDMIGRGRAPGSPAPGGSLPLTDTETVYVVGSRRLSTQLGALLEQANDRYHRLRLDYSLDAPDDPADIYRRSDHYQYAKRGIPVAFFFTGVHEDYHRVDDEVDRIDFTKLRRVVQTIYAAARLVADTKERPALDVAQ